MQILSIRAAITALSMTALAAIACSPQSNQGSAIGSAEDNSKLFQQYNILDFNLAGSKRVVLTYDDGPTPSVTSELLDYLDSENVQATFFIVGRNARNYPNIMSDMARGGHIVANHSSNHANLRGGRYTGSPTAIIGNIQESHSSLVNFMSPSHRLYFRAPFGAWSASHADKLNNVRGLRDYIGPIFWDIGGELRYKDGSIYASADWACWSNGVSAQKCAEGYIKEISRKQGGVILLHDVKMNTVTLTKILVPWLKDNGYEIISLDRVRSLDKYQFDMIPKRR